VMYIFGTQSEKKPWIFGLKENLRLFREMAIMLLFNDIRNCFPTITACCSQCKKISKRQTLHKQFQYIGWFVNTMLFFSISYFFIESLQKRTISLEMYAYTLQMLMNMRPLEVSESHSNISGFHRSRDMTITKRILITLHFKT
jgi:hypothetical protein